MTLRDFPLFTDENIDPILVAFLREEGFDVVDVKESGWFGKTDLELMPIAFSEQRVIVTHDSDFGTIIFTQQEPFVGVVYLRPGHFSAAPHRQTLQTILTETLTISVPSILIAENTGESVRVRIRQL